MAQPLSVDYNLEISTKNNGLVILLEGWSDNFEKFIDMFLAEFEQVDINSELCNWAKDVVISNYKQYEELDALHQAFQISLNEILINPYFHYTQVIKAASEIGHEDIIQYLDEFKTSLTLKQLIIGNISPKEANKLTEKITLFFLREDQFYESINTQKTQETEQQNNIQSLNKQDKYINNRFLFTGKKEEISKIRGGNSFVYRQYLDGNEENLNSATLNYYQYGPRTLKSFASMHLLVDILNSHEFNYLRTQRELGYVVFCMMVSHSCIDGFVIGVEGSQFSPQIVDGEIEQSLFSFNEKLLNLQDDEFLNIKESTIQTLSLQQKDLNQETKFYMEYMIQENYTFDLNKRAIDEINKLEKNDLINIYEEIFKSQNSGKISIQRYTKAQMDSIQIGDNILKKSQSFANIDQVVINDIKDFVSDRKEYAGFHNFVGRPISGYEAPECILTLQAATNLSIVQKILLSQNKSLKVYDCYRPQKAVDDFIQWSQDPRQISMKEEFYPTINKDEIFPLGYVAKKSGHTRGSTMDVTIVELPPRKEPVYIPGEILYSCINPPNSRWPDNSIDFGTGFDCFNEMAHTDSENVTQEVHERRMYFKNLMLENGFKNYINEWWHFTLIDEPFPNTYFDFNILPKQQQQNLRSKRKQFNSIY